MQVSTNCKLKRIKQYYAEQGWIEELVVLNNIVCELDSKDMGEELIALMENYCTFKCKAFFERYKKHVTSHTNQVNELKLFNTWSAFDAAVIK